MSDDTATPAAEQENQTAETSDEELLKQKKEEAKAAKEAEKAEKKAAKEERVHGDHHGKEAAAQPARNPMKMHGKKYRAAAEKIDKNTTYALEEAVKLAKETSTTKFDAAVEIHTRLGIDPKKTDQQIRSTVVLPHGTGKTLKVVAFVDDAQVADAKKAGAVEAGSEDLVEKIAKGWMDFDMAVATPAMMKAIGKIARQLGQSGKMPNPKAGTVTDNIAQAIEEIQKGKVEFRNDKTGILHNLVGKVSFDEAKLVENVQAYLAAVEEMKPKSVKGAYIASITLTTSMGPGVKVDLKSIS